MDAATKALICVSAPPPKRGSCVTTAVSSTRRPHPPPKSVCRIEGSVLSVPACCDSPPRDGLGVAATEYSEAAPERVDVGLCWESPRGRF